ncbi:MAG TPA: NAD-dependent epimerase/dehydratase family protein [Usitatibacter sp.]|nr:NAD-dependent epimerase/dehydratase family protein [Usitatibacter sp.]
MSHDIAKPWVTGATGFVGRFLTARLPASSQLHFGAPGWAEQLARADLRGATVFHLAARVHDALPATAQDYRRDNVEKTEALANAARKAGARRLVFLSTVKVNGEETFDRPFTAADAPQPQDDYARSKWEAEQRLAALGGLEICIVRCPLVYGARSAGNLGRLLRLADSPWPLPLAGIANRRSFIHVDDLVTLLLACATHGNASGATFVAAHPQPVSTAQVVATMRRHLGRPERLFAMGSASLEALAALAGARDKAMRLTRNLEVDASETTRRVGWSARASLDDAVRDTVRGYREAAA